MKSILFFILLSSPLFATEEKALKAINSLGMTLKKELKTALKKSPVHAIGICNTTAMKLTKDAALKGIEVGRVSLKNRNPQNYPKQWMLAFINKYHRNEINKPHIVVKLSETKSGLLKPIKTEPLCLNCHGGNLSSDVAVKIKGLYPKDKAVGYKTGEIRGFFWAEFFEVKDQ